MSPGHLCAECPGARVPGARVPAKDADGAIGMLEQTIPGGQGMPLAPLACLQQSHQGAKRANCTHLLQVEDGRAVQRCPDQSCGTCWSWSARGPGTPASLSVAASGSAAVTGSAVRVWS